MCLFHKHLDWKQYIDDEVSNRDEYELALATCTSCLQEYMLLLEDTLESPPPEFTDSVMSQLPGVRRNRYTFKPLMHYFVAACLTLVLIELGAFDWLFTGSAEITPTPNPDFFPELMEHVENVLGLFKTNLGGM